MMLSSILAVPIINTLFRKIVEKRGEIDEFLSHIQGIEVLDIGCGTAEYVDKFLDAQYTGIDVEPKYIEVASKAYSRYENVKFFCTDANTYLHDMAEMEGGYDLILMRGVMHHLNDKEVEDCLTSIGILLNPEGEFRSIDPIFINGQSWIERRLLHSDRGKYIRTMEEYETMFKKAFRYVTYKIKPDMFRIPWTIIEITARREAFGK